MELLFDLSLEEDDDSERDLRALPHIISWFETAKEAIAEPVGEDGDSYSSGDSVPDEDERHDYNLQGRKLSAIYQFVTAMPMLFIPASHTLTKSEGEVTTNKLVSIELDDLSMK